jgi:YHS domain-containing protein
VSEQTPTKVFATLCGRIYRDADPQYFPSAEYRGRKLLFCTEACLGAFLADPDIFCKVHRNTNKPTSRLKAES